MATRLAAFTLGENEAADEVVIKFAPSTRRRVRARKRNGDDETLLRTVFCLFRTIDLTKVLLGVRGTIIDLNL